VVMAITGLILAGFLLVHALGNLQLLWGPARLDAYAAALQSMPAVVWGMRTVLLLSVLLHILSAALLWLQNRASRPVRYQVQQYRETSYAARTMIWGGPIIALFVLYHLLHFTTGSLHGSFVHGRVYANVVAGFSVWWIALVYIAANLTLGFHLYHGMWSWLQTLGANHPKYNQWRQIFAAIFAGVVGGINVFLPLVVLLGIRK
jgi:succinate dehydrogenase / fumarate reductase cytochrome b subunit